jgi:hypothetical protein
MVSTASVQLTSWFGLAVSTNIIVICTKIVGFVEITDGRTVDPLTFWGFPATIRGDGSTKSILKMLT